MNRTEELIGTALRDIAEEATNPRPLAAQAWRAGRRRRAGGLISAAAGVAAAVAIAVAVLPGHAVGSAGGTGGGQVPTSGRHQPTAVTGKQPAVTGKQPAAIRLRSPLVLRQVSTVSQQSCPPHSAGLPGTPNVGQRGPGECFSLTHYGMTITTVQSAAVRSSTTSDGYTVVLVLNRSNAQRFGEVTTSIYNRQLPFPRDELAVVVQGRVVDTAVVDRPITTGQFTINCGSRALAEQLLHNL